ncbi:MULTISPECIES: 4'-phosphopantetheinyl transferase superfamily protein [unclassified Janthinobacterium]|uniref:4'-phosphopantetheinyl transferase family protein n=1 Tax=unclassified Janthinobacterium TaxID=2610881 RepID=UPI00160A8B0F|nr:MULTISPECIES: 4'-phosphopantetheinyl transferase superfamily protein [unclassified Janthinobacterium]MBB5368974.1 4'-phosphopantetheinyl transferase [Janthinobacterium sp. K2C7]MBB5381490.1 4'-phosphopantetheinyl transferase [Janthinobacterium sp. K2Li3]MBB5387356.1 4'-phosphopantetheinyl transferase [Janthinobacterium sp. K2E3]
MSFSIVWSGDGVLAIAIAAPPSRVEARARVRQAVREAAAQWLSIDIDSISVKSSPGQAPSVMLAGRTAGLSISHEEGLSLAAIHLHGKVGIDVMRVVAIPDWEIVARDYLGLQVTSQLAAMPAAERPRAMAQAWTAREAALKCAGLQLAEWTDAIIDCRLQALPVQRPYVATLAY